MKLKQLITGGALAATVLTLGSAQAETNPYDGIVFCKATVVPSPEQMNPGDFSITLPITEGRDYTYWNLGNVPAGGVADSWHGEGGPGRFLAHNNGRVGAYIYMTSASSDKSYSRFGQGAVNMQAVFDGSDFSQALLISPTPSLRGWRRDETGSRYCLAFTRDVLAKMPTWHMLDRFTDQGDNFYVSPDRFRGWLKGDVLGDALVSGYVGAYMGYLDANDYMPFDVKFWVPHYQGKGDAVANARFTFMVEAAPFPLWEHDIEVK